MRTKVVFSALRASAVAAVALASVSYAAEPGVETNVVFGTYSGLALVMDVHRPAASNGLGIIVIHGSAWNRDTAYDASLITQSTELRLATDKLVSVGYTTFVISHRAAPRFHLDDMIQDVQRATRFIRANASRYGIRPDRIGALGGSSGAHLASMLATLDGKGDADATDPVDRESAKVQCVVALYPAVDLAQIDTPGGLVNITLATDIMRPAPRNVAGTALATKRLRSVSPVTYVTPDDPPFLLIHGESDRVVPFQQSEIMEAALRQMGIAVKLVRVPGGEHGTGSVGWDKVDWPGLTFEWFETRLRGTASTAAR